MSAGARPIVRLQHEGVFCAIPLELVGAADRDPPEPRGVLRLWSAGAARDRAGATEGRFVRHLRITTPAGYRWIEGRQIAVGWLDPAATWPLPDVLRASLRMPHVVALTELDGALAWVVDPGQLGEVGAP